MRRILALTFMISLAFVPIGNGSPTDGSWGESVGIPTSPAWETTKSFRGGERACVLAIGDHQQEIPNLHVAIYDKNNQLVAEDKGENTLVGDYVAVIWYPPRDGNYRIVVRNPASGINKCYIAIK